MEVKKGDDMAWKGIKHCNIRNSSSELKAGRRIPRSMNNLESMIDWSGLLAKHPQAT